MALEALSTTRLQLTYNAPDELVEFPPGLNSAVRYRSEFDPPGVWQSVDTAGFPGKADNHSLTLDDVLPYAEYTVQIRLISAAVSRIEEMHEF